MKRALKTWHLHAVHIVESIDKIDRFLVRGGLEDEMAYEAIIRCLATLSESTESIPLEIKTHYPEIEWKNIKGLRNILVHDYLGDVIDLKVIKSSIDNNLPLLKKIIQDMLQQFPDSAIKKV